MCFFISKQFHNIWRITNDFFSAVKMVTNCYRKHCTFIYRNYCILSYRYQQTICNVSKASATRYLSILEGEWIEKQGTTGVGTIYVLKVHNSGT
jgi:hypothetical protein